MKRPRFSIGRLMVVVGVVALNLGAGRVAFAIDPWVLAGSAPAALMLEFAAYRFFRLRGRGRVRARAFWAGFLVAGLLAAGSLAWGFLFRESVNVGINLTTGEKTTIRTPGFASADRAWAAWSGYLQLMVSGLERVPATRGLLTRDGVPQVVAGTLMVWLPQLLIAAAGGVLASGLARRTRSGLPPAPTPIVYEGA